MSDPRDQQYLVWSNEHRAWWRPNSAGYTRDVRRAGRYSRQEAIDISGTARNGWTDPTRLPDELAISVNDLPADIFASMMAVSSTERLCPDCGRSIDGPTHAAYCAISPHDRNEAGK